MQLIVHLSVTNSHNLKLQEARIIAGQENEAAMMKAKSETEDTIRKLNQQIILERGKLLAEQQQNATNLEAEFGRQPPRPLPMHKIPKY